MSQQTKLLTTLYYFKTYQSRADVDYDIEVAEHRIQAAQQRLHELAWMTEPQKFCAGMDVSTYVNEETDKAMYELEDALIEKHQLCYLYNNWDDCHDANGLGYDMPELEHESYIDGDFVNTVNHPNKSTNLC